MARRAQKHPARPGIDLARAARTARPAVRHGHATQAQHGRARCRVVGPQAAAADYRRSGSRHRAAGIGGEIGRALQDRTGKRRRDRRAVHVAEGRDRAACRRSPSRAITRWSSTTITRRSPSRRRAATRSATHGARCTKTRRRTPRRSGASPRKSTDCGVPAMAASATSRRFRRSPSRARNAAATRVAISPMHAMFSAEPQKFSPYSPSSRLFLNIAHIDPAAVLGAPAARAAIERAGVAQELAALEDLSLIDWPRASTAKLAILRALFELVLARPRFAVRERLCIVRRKRRARARRPRALRSAAGRPARERGRRPLAQLARRIARSRAAPPLRRSRNRIVRDVDFYLFTQWLASKGLAHAQHAARDAGMAIGLVADLAVGCDSAGSHAWSYRDEMLHGRFRRRAARPFQSGGTIVGPHHVLPARDAHARFLRVHRHAARVVRARGRHPHRSHSRLAAPVARARRRTREGRRVPALSARRPAAPDRARIVAASRDRGRRGPRHRAARLSRAAGGARPARHPRAVVRAREAGRRLQAAARMGPRTSPRPRPPTTCRPSPAGGAARTSNGARRSARRPRARTAAIRSRLRG